MAVVAGASGVQEATQVVHILLEGVRVLASGTMTIMAKWKELNEKLKHEKAAKTLGEGGEMSPGELKKLLDDVYKGEDTLCTVILKREQLDAFSYLAKKTGLAFSTYGDYLTNDKQVCVTFPGSQKALMQIVLKQGNIEDITGKKADEIEFEELGEEAKMGLTDYKNKSVVQDETLAQLIADFSSKLDGGSISADQYEAEAKESQITIHAQYLNQRAKQLNIRNIGEDLGLGDPDAWRKQTERFRSDKIKDPTAFLSSLKTDTLSFKDFDRSQLTFHTLQEAVLRNPINIVFFGKQELDICAQYDAGHKDASSYKGSANSYFYWAKCALLTQPDIFAYLQSGKMAHPIQSSKTLATIACLGGEADVSTDKGQQILKGKGDPRMFRYVKLKEPELSDLGKQIVQKDPLSAGIVLEKCPTPEMYQFVFQELQKQDYMKDMLIEDHDNPDKIGTFKPGDYQIKIPEDNVAIKVAIAGDILQKGKDLVYGENGYTKTGMNKFGEGISRVGRIREAKRDLDKSVDKVNEKLSQTKVGKTFDKVTDKLTDTLDTIVHSGDGHIPESR